jgi:tRNA threonylcarbamoyladenosine biosynthesis protein TsaB
MLLLALDTTTTVCGVALGDENNLWAESFLNIKRTHSQRLMPLLISLLEHGGFDKKELEGIVVTTGPGSFTGIRIGIATARGLAHGLGIPIIGVMTLDALAEAAAFHEGLVCPLLDARKSQVYTALYKGGREGLKMLEPAAALSLEELIAMLKNETGEILFLGDGVKSYGEELKQALPERYREMPSPMLLNRASFVLQKGFKLWQENGPAPLYHLKPFYLRPSEAERRLREIKKGRRSV